FMSAETNVTLSGLAAVLVEAPNASIAISTPRAANLVGFRCMVFSCSRGGDAGGGDNAGIVLLLCMRSSSSRSDTAGTRGSGWKTGMGRSGADEPQAPRAAPAVEVDGSDQNGPDGDQL